VYIDGDNFPCGTDCVKEKNDSCEETCSDKPYYGSPNGVCIFLSCSDRISVVADTYICGTDCVLNIEDYSCADSCPETNYYLVKDGACDDEIIMISVFILIGVVGGFLLLIIIIVIIIIFIRKKVNYY
jgi:hypothetical protein